MATKKSVFGHDVPPLARHKVYKKKGKVVTPFNDAMGDSLFLDSWSRRRMPDYLWMGLILLKLGREEGFEAVARILQPLAEELPALQSPALSAIFALSEKERRRVYGTISEEIPSGTLAPLTVIYRKSTHPMFHEIFSHREQLIEKRIEALVNAVKIFRPHQSNEATDLRFLSLATHLFQGKIHISQDCQIAGEVFQNYPYTDHSDEKMRLYRPTIRCMDSMVYEGDSEFTKSFWEEIGMITPCKPTCIGFEDLEDMDYQKFATDTRRVLEETVVTNKELLLSDPKFEVILGSVTYASRIFSEMVDGGVQEGILGRHAVRTITEMLLILKYLLKSEAEHPEVWREYKQYGIGKAKLILVKARECKDPDSYHIAYPILDIIVNEEQSEEFTDMDLKYFDKQGIREKAIDVGEKELYDLSYDYDSGYAHGLWGAVRESAMLPCDQPAHHHCVPDFRGHQKLKNVGPECVRTMVRLVELVHGQFTVPEWYLTEYRSG